MNPRDFQTLAMSLLEDKQPVKCRTAISRAYYAVFNTSVEILRGMGLPVSPGPSGHGEVRNYFLNGGIEDIKKVGSQLNDLHSKRIKADYHLTDVGSENPNTAEVVVRQSEKMIKTLDLQCLGTEREHIIKLLKDYAQNVLRKQV